MCVRVLLLRDKLIEGFVDGYFYFVSNNNNFNDSFFFLNKSRKS